MMRQSNLTPMEKRRCIEFVENLVRNANGSEVMELPYKDYNNLIKELLGGEGEVRRSQAIRNCLITSLSAYGFKMAWAKSGVVLIKTNNETYNYVKFIPALRRYLADEVIRNYERYIIRRDEKGVVIRLTRRDTERLKRELGIASTQLLVYALTTTAELMGLKVISVWRGKVKIFIPFELLNEVPISERFKIFSSKF
jgi:hypothetical protein